MKITSINNQNTFKGLWGESIKTNEQKQNGKNLILANYETRVYYPFGDESIEDANKVLRENSTYKKIAEQNADTLCIKEIGTDVSIKSRLFFTAKQWMNYINNKFALSNIELELIEQNLKKLKLEKYMKA